MKAVAFFDVDGTLVPGISSAVHLAGHLGRADAVAEAEAAWDAGLVSARYVEELDARGWAGTSETQIREWLGVLPLVDGIAEVVEWCVDHDVIPALATLAWHPVGVYLCETFGFVDTCGPRLEVRDGIYTGIPLSSYDSEAKRDFAVRFAKERGLTLDRCVAVGDSLSDLPLFAEVGLAVAFNATERARALADVEVTGRDLRAVLPSLENWLGSQ
ncbi:HAD family hydrolase [Kribbella steppae]|uniref:HAD family hydrolase n=1 Tax=Kribbella steppae TaxID=2512223 RepID=UPI0018EE5649|nr:haloacid dehalogenase-like hydrolase [Kribbella steppae]